MPIRRFRPLVLVALLAACAHGGRAPAPDPARDQEAVRAAVMASAAAANARDPRAIMALFARDLVLSYPGIPDQDYASLEQSFTEMMALPPGVNVTTVPNIEEILVVGDMAAVRMTWTTTTTVAATDSTPARASTRRMRDFAVWRREPDGSWKFARGMHFRMPDEAARP